MHSCPNFKSAIASSHPAVVRLFGALLWAVLGLSCGAESKVEQRPRNVILICWDTVRADHLGPYGYSLRPTTPALDALATRSTVFTDASATAGWTKPSVPSILTGLMPAEHGVFEGSASFELGKTTDVLPESAVTLAEVFQGRGFRTAAFVKNAQLRPGNGFEQGFETYRDEVGDARDIRWAGLDWLDSLQPEDSFFLYLHALDAHWPYAIPDAAAKRFVELERVRMFQEKSFKEIVDRIQDGEREFSADERDDLLALYDGAISYLDQQLGFLIEGLALRGLEEDTVIVLVSDHGEEFGEHGRIGHGHGLYQGLLQVPFVIHVPGRAAQRVEHPTSLIDLYPTLLNVFGFASPPHLLGVDRLTTPELDHPILAEHKAPNHYLQALRLPSTEQVVVREVRAPAGVVVADESWPFRLGERLEAKLERDANGFHVTKVELEDSDPENTTEFKGVVSHFGSGTFMLSNVEVHFDEATELKWGADVLDHELRDRRGVKVEGHFQEGVLVAQKIKLYPAAADIGLVVRGQLDEPEAGSPAGSYRIGGLTVQVDAWSKISAPSSGSRRQRMEREAVVQFLELGAREAQGSGFSLSAWSYDLGEDHRELRRIEQDPLGPGASVELLDRLGNDLIQNRIFSKADRIHLTEDAIEALRGLGYVR